MKVWKLDDCDYVAAETLDDALVWYKNETGVDVEEWEEAELMTESNVSEEGEPPIIKTFAKMIEDAQANRERFPQILGTDSYYA